MVNLALVLAPAVVVAIIVAYVAALKTRHHYTSLLTCPHCGRSFRYDWVPGVSFNAIRLGKSRYMKCPLCNEWSTFDIWSTRIASQDASKALSNEKSSG